jgi:hypothetical protein
MMMQVSKVWWAAVVIVFSLTPCFSQGWERTFGASQNDGLSDVLATPDGGYIAVGATQTGPMDRNVLLLKTDADGIQQWSKHIDHPAHELYGKSIEPASDGGYIVGGTSFSDGAYFGFLIKTDGSGNVQWKLFSVDSVQGRRAIQLSDGSYALVGNKFHTVTVAGVPTLDYDVFLMKTQADTVAWWNTYGGSFFDDGYGIAEIPGQGLLLAGVTNDTTGNGDYDVLVIRTDFEGNEIWNKKHGSPAAETGFSIAPCANGNFTIAGKSEYLTPESEDVLLYKITPGGNILSWRTFAKPGLETARSVHELSDGSFILAGDVRAGEGAQRNVLLLKTNANGDEIWTKEFGGVLGDAGHSVRQASNGGFVIAGTTYSYGAGGQDGYLIRTDSSGVSLSNLIRGNVHSNLNSNCIPDNMGQNIPGYLVEIAGTFTWFATTDEHGDYAVYLPEGTFNVRLINPTDNWEACQDSVDVTLSGTFDTATVDFSLYALTQCPVMEVDISTLGLRRCFGNKYSVKYRNLGSEIATPAHIEVTFDPYLTVDSASIQWSSNVGNTYVFNVGDVGPFESGSFDVFVTVDCDSTVLGQTHCSEANIFPDSLCFAPNPEWDGSSVQLSAACQGDSVVFTLTNVGGGDMTAPQNLIVIEDVIMGLQGSFILPSGSDTTFTFPATGATFRMEAGQSPGHPGNSQPSVSVEGCGASPFSTGYVVQYPLNDAGLTVDMDCRGNTGSFDPNDKQGFPTGYGLEHFIEKNTDLEYLIRFQNTGTDTAFTVVVRDTLSPFLAPQSIQPGAASHPYRFEMYGNGIVKFIFENIMLPDSNVNEPASHGFVKFRISQRPGNPLGAVIENSAAIYFDFNAPIITNTTFHTIGENFIVTDPVLSAAPGGQTPPIVKVYPNPFLEKATFELKNVQANRLTFNLFDLSGRQVRQAVFDKNIFQFERNGLASGIYFFRFETENRVIASGKIALR